VVVDAEQSRLRAIGEDRPKIRQPYVVPWVATRRSTSAPRDKTPFPQTIVVRSDPTSGQRWQPDFAAVSRGEQRARSAASSAVVLVVNRVSEWLKYKSLCREDHSGVHYHQASSSASGLISYIQAVSVSPIKPRKFIPPAAPPCAGLRRCPHVRAETRGCKVDQRIRRQY
jgi:hypothetical protein